ncbi:hypothetical protein Pmar_PMAR016794 [Perkinsus marinus ATCC 50983]|uniref:Uncharacterized protein n=1 Tax=Perkinsus marinus (strain ATCC 50983 / TXsc) TaxID=423536 RepID=C5KQ72_PERM5|nr:hypothetical protein Pmar_PMAR016794 [Perkinsus marinus ATCC 50983]EER13371.1 hypothetical protein Pmar_PMAR016794 [Perkinsus marinus ATCC 50983]|eukprot:XP_002781576.1 hypothetical protein Pmar_PMAR016794 [Perkinsus marinus ATCC 50983]
MPPGGMMLPAPPPGMFPSAAEGGPPFNLPLFFAAQAAQQGATPEAEMPHSDYSTGTAEQILLLNQYIQQAAGVLAEDNNVPAEPSGEGPTVPHVAPEDRSSAEAVVPSAHPSEPSAVPPSPTDTASDVVQAMLAASGMLDAANAAAAAAGVDTGNGREARNGSMPNTDSNGADGDPERPHKMQRAS